MLRFIESFDHYVTADLGEKWSAVSGAWTISAGNGRHSSSSLRQSSSVNCFLGKVLTAQPTWIVGMAMRHTARPISPVRLVEWYDGITRQMELRLTASGVFTVTRDGTLLGTSTYVLPLNTYVYVECRITIHNSTGSATVRADGATVLTLTGQDTQVSANASANEIRLGNMGSDSLGTQDIDDVYLCDGSGTTNTDCLGDCRVDVLLPTGEGTYTAWTPSTGTTHSMLIDESAPNDDTDYLSTATAGARDSVALGNLPTMTAPVIYGLQHLVSARKDDAGTRQVKALLKSGATTQVGSTTHTLASAYLYYSQIWETDPHTTAAWTPAAIDALEAGVEAQ